jgi:hypothetical protein
VFFDTASRLVSADHNSTRDVYAYQDGHLALISPGDGPYTARFADASADGSNVFFTTDQSLVAQDDNSEIDVYDARIGGGFPEPPPPTPPCQGDACKGEIGAPPSALTPGSSAFGSAKAPVKGSKRCPEGKRKVKAHGKTRCVKHKKTKKHTNKGKGGRRSR